MSGLLLLLLLLLLTPLCASLGTHLRGVDFPNVALLYGLTLCKRLLIKSSPELSSSVVFVCLAVPLFVFRFCPRRVGPVAPVGPRRV